ncbi:hypothetical protein ACN2CC_02050 [Mesorhizobium muleiense]|uniref:hypothetical protein n=1 Tax=Mesorhizobium muleiense TaxID=1004279 RepID=UPI003AFA1CCD
MPKIVVNGAEIALTPTGPWKWSASGDDLKVTVDTADTKISGGGTGAPLASTLLDVIKRNVAGQSYLHRDGAQPGKVESVEAKLDAGTEARNLTADGEALATDATTGRFTIMAGDPSKIPTAGGVESDPLMVHSGTWRIPDAHQAPLTEAERGGGAAGTGAAAPVAAQGLAAAPKKKGRASKGPAGATALRLNLSLSSPSAAAPKDGLGDAQIFRLWATALLEDRARLLLEILVAQPARQGGLAGRFIRSVSASDLVDHPADGSVAPAQKPLAVALDPIVLDPAAPIWVAISARVAGQRPRLGAVRIGLTAEFAPADQKTAVVAPVLPKGRAGLSRPQSSIFVTEGDVFGSGGAGPAQRLVEAVSATEGWTRFDADPPAAEPGQRDWHRLRQMQTRRFTFVESKDEAGVVHRRCEPLALTLVPDSPGLLALRAIEPGLTSANEELEKRMLEGLETASLAQVLSELLRGSKPVSEATRDALHEPFHVPDSFRSTFGDPRVRNFYDRTAGLVRRGYGDSTTGITAPDFYLVLRCADLREKGLALVAEAKPLFKLLATASVGAEWATAAIRGGPAALTWDYSKTASTAEGQLISLAMASRLLEPSCSAFTFGTALAAKIASTLGAIDAYVQRVARLLGRPPDKGLWDKIFTGPYPGSLLDADASPLLSPELKSAMEVALVKAGALDALVGKAVLSPAAAQPPETLKTLHEGLKVGKEGTENLQRLHEISEAVRARVQAYRAQTILQIELVEQLSAVMSYALTQGSTQILQQVRTTATTHSVVSIPRYGDPRMDTVRWLEMEIAQHRIATGELSGVIREGSQVERATLRFGSPGGPKEKLLLTSARHSSSIEKVAEGFGAAFAAFDLIHRFADDDAKDLVENGLSIAADFFTLAALAKHYEFADGPMGKLATNVARAASPIAAGTDALVGSYKLYRDWDKKSTRGRTADTLGVVAAYAALGVSLVELGAAAYLVEAAASPYIVAAATYLIAAAPYLVAVALVFSVASMLLADEVPDDIHLCLEALQHLVESSIFDKQRLLDVIKAQPPPATVIMAGGRAVAYIQAVRPSDDEVAWLTRFRELEDLSAAKETRGLVLVESLVRTVFRKSRIDIGQPPAGVVWPSWLGRTRPMHGTWIALPIPIVLTSPGSIVVLPYGPQRQSRLRVTFESNSLDCTIRCAAEGAVHGAGLAMQSASVASRSEQEGDSDQKSEPGVFVAMSEGASGAVAEVTVPLVPGAGMFHLFVVAEGMGAVKAELALENPAIDGPLPRREDGHEATFRADFTDDAVSLKQP